MAGLRKSHPRFRREGEAPHVELTNDDIKILRHVHRHRFISADDLYRLLSHRSEDKIARRLTRLWRGGFLDRPQSQRDYHHQGAGSRRYVYALDNGGARFLKDRLGLSIDTGDWRTRNREFKRDNLDHTLAVTRFLIDVELACAQRGDVAYLSFEEILERSPSETRESSIPAGWRVPVSWRGNRGAIVIHPDGIFGLRKIKPDGKQEESYFFLEIDRGKMTIVPTEQRRESETFVHRTSVLRKLVCYGESHRQHLHQKQFGIPSARVLTLTTGDQRAEAMQRAAADHVIESLRVPPGLFLFGAQSTENPLESRLRNAAGAESRILG